jgi:hypothetical protein
MDEKVLKVAKLCNECITSGEVWLCPSHEWYEEGLYESKAELARLTRERDGAVARLKAAGAVVEAARVAARTANLRTLAHLDTALAAYDAATKEPKP